MKIITVVVLILVMGTVSILAVVNSGVINVAATSQESDVVSWLLETARIKAIEKNAVDIMEPNLLNEKHLAKGGKAFSEMCVSCHGGPGKSAFLGAADMNPPPPDLTEVVMLRTPGELFWVVKNGIRMTGMPAWGPTHNDEQIWELVAFMKRLPELTPEVFNELVLMIEDDGHAHDHGQTEPVNKDSGLRNTTSSDAVVESHHASSTQHHLKSTKRDNAVSHHDDSFHTH